MEGRYKLLQELVFLRIDKGKLFGLMDLLVILIFGKFLYFVDVCAGCQN